MWGLRRRRGTGGGGGAGGYDSFRGQARLCTAAEARIIKADLPSLYCNLISGHGRRLLNTPNARSTEFLVWRRAAWYLCERALVMHWSP